MRGRVLGFDTSTGEGMISGDDGRRYPVSRTELQGGARMLFRGQTVDFEVSSDGRAVSVYPLSSGLLGEGEKNRVLAAILALLLGALGIHKFYLGKNRAGIIHLLCVFPGSILFGIPTVISTAIALAECVIYLVKSDEQFYEEYVVGDREWF